MLCVINAAGSRFKLLMNDYRRERAVYHTHTRVHTYIYDTTYVYERTREVYFQLLHDYYFPKFSTERISIRRSYLCARAASASENPFRLSLPRPRVI